MPLPEHRRAQLDEIVQRMSANNESDESIQLVVQDFTSKYAGEADGDLLVDNVRVLGTAAKDAVVGAAKGAANTAVGLGRLVHKIPGVSEAVDTLYESAGVEDMDSGRLYGEGAPADAPSASSRLGLDPANTPERVGRFVEQAAEYMIPGGAVRRGLAAVAPVPAGAVVPAVAAEAATGASVAAAQGEDPLKAGAASAAIPVIGASTRRAIPYLKEQGVRWARAGIKPTVTALREMAGQSRQGLDAAARQLAQFIVRNRILSAEQASALVDEAELAVQGLVGNQPTDAPARAARYLQALRRSAAKQGLGRDQVATIEGAAQELLEGPMGRNVVTATTTMQPSRILNAQGQPIMVPVTTHQTTRALRPSTPADETLASARSSSSWSTRRAWGEKKGASTEADKAVERAQRDAVKAAVPATKPVFGVYSKSIKARDVLDRMETRQSNRDVVGFPSQIVGARELAQGRVPIMAMAMNYLRSNQLKGGIWLDKLADALKRNDVRSVSEIMGRLGVATVASHQPSADATAMESELLERARALQ